MLAVFADRRNDERLLDARLGNKTTDFARSCFAAPGALSLMAYMLQTWDRDEDSKARAAAKPSICDAGMRSTVPRCQCSNWSRNPYERLSDRLHEAHPEQCVGKTFSIRTVVPPIASPR